MILFTRSIGHVFSYVTVRLVGQSLSALCTSSLQNVSAVGSSHSLSETMLFLSLTLFGLVSSEHNGTSLVLESEAYRPQDTMHAFYSDSIYYIRRESILSSVFFILGDFFTFFLHFPVDYGVFHKKEWLSLFVPRPLAENCAPPLTGKCFACTIKVFIRSPQGGYNLCSKISENPFAFSPLFLPSYASLASPHSARCF